MIDSQRGAQRYFLPSITLKKVFIGVNKRQRRRRGWLYIMPVWYHEHNFKRARFRKLQWAEYIIHQVYLFNFLASFCFVFFFFWFWRLTILLHVRIKCVHKVILALYQLSIFNLQIDRFQCHAIKKVNQNLSSAKSWEIVILLKIKKWDIFPSFRPVRFPKLQIYVEIFRRDLQSLVWKHRIGVTPWYTNMEETY